VHLQAKESSTELLDQFPPTHVPFAILNHDVLLWEASIGNLNRGEKINQQDFTKYLVLCDSETISTDFNRWNLHDFFQLLVLSRTARINIPRTRNKLI
jgi:hypothetical protein